MDEADETETRTCTLTFGGNSPGGAVSGRPPLEDPHRQLCSVRFAAPECFGPRASVAVSNDWINRLCVCGPARDVDVFAVTANDPWIARHQLAARPKRGRPLGLSFGALIRSLPAQRVRQLEQRVTEPWELSLDSPIRLGDGMVARTYRFQLTDYEPDALLTEVSRKYPGLCLILGWIDPNTDDQASRFMHRGRSILYRLSRRRKVVLQASVPEAGTADEDEIAWALVEADWAMMDAVMAHWDQKVRSVLRETLTTRNHRG